jgi:preprotein translocase subunit SecD
MRLTAFLLVAIAVLGSSSDAESGPASKWTVLTYRIDTGDRGDEESAKLLEDARRTLRKRLDEVGFRQAEIEKVGTNGIRISLPSVDPGSVRKAKGLAVRGRLEFRVLARDGDPTVAGPLNTCKEREALARNPAYPGPPRSTDEAYPHFRWIEWRDKPRHRAGVHEIDQGWISLVRVDRWNFGGDDLEEVSVRQHHVKGEEWIVLFGIKDRREKEFGDFTGSNSDEDLGVGKGRRMAIVLDGEILAAPTILSRLTDGGYIEGRFTLEEARALVGVLRSGSLHVLPKLVREETVSR